MSSPTSSLVKHVPVSTRDWDDYEERLVLYKKYKFFCYAHNHRPILFPSHWRLIDCQIFLEVVPYM